MAWWACLIVTTGIAVFGFVSTCLFLQNLWEKIGWLHADIQEHPEIWDGLNIGRMSSTLYADNLSVSTDFAAFYLLVGTTAAMACTVFLLATILVRRRNQHNQPSQPIAGKPGSG